MSQFESSFLLMRISEKGCKIARAVPRCLGDMIIHFEDFNNSDQVISANYSNAWNEVRDVLASLPLHLKASDQAGIQGTPIFDPVGTNEYLKDALTVKGWEAAVAIPGEFSYLGQDVDFGKRGVIVEVQFSNYPFLLNNLLRAEFLYQSQHPLASHPTKLAIIITKAHMFPASQSTLYYEQGVEQLRGLSKYGVFDVPIRLVGLFSEQGQPVDAKWTEYERPRYSRTVVSRVDRKCRLLPPSTNRGRCTIELL